MKCYYPAEKVTGYKQIVELGAATEYTGLGLLTLDAGEKTVLRTKPNEESALIILSGKCDIIVEGRTFHDLGGRKDVFSGRATAVYIPINTGYEITALSEGVKIAVTSALAQKKYAAFVVTPKEVVVNHRGVMNWQRDVHDIIVESGEGRVDRIVVGETFTYPGNWSSYPSHKHDVYNPPYESKLDEIYYFRVKPATGFGIQVLYNDDLTLREAYMIKDGDTVAIPKGYHPVAAAPGYQVYYLWVMAGGYGRTLTPHDDPNHAWLGNIAPMLKG